MESREDERRQRVSDDADLDPNGGGVIADQATVGSPTQSLRWRGLNVVVEHVTDRLLRGHSPASFQGAPAAEVDSKNRAPAGGGLCGQSRSSEGLGEQAGSIDSHAPLTLRCRTYARTKEPQSPSETGIEGQHRGHDRDEHAGRIRHGSDGPFMLSRS